VPDKCYHNIFGRFEIAFVRGLVPLIFCVQILTYSSLSDGVVFTNDNYCHNKLTIVFSQLGEDQDGFWYTCLGNPQPFPLEDGFGISSPNGDWLIFITRDELQIRSATDQTIEVSFSWQGNWLRRNIQWVNNEIISISTQSGRVLLNPWTGEELSIEPELPFLAGNSYFNNDGSYVVYVGRTQSEPYFLALYDVAENDVIWQVANYFATLPAYAPVWSPEGPRFVYRRPILETETTLPYFEMFLVNVNGGEEQITNLSQDGLNTSLIDFPTWSPDEQFIAFWWSSPDTPGLGSSNFRLGVLEVETENITMFDVYHQPMGAFDIVWSPSSDNIAVIAGLDPTVQELFSVDIHTGETERLAENVSSIRAWCNCLSDGE
jgi:hypothetical protein